MLRHWTSHLNQTKVGTKSLFFYAVGAWLESLEILFVKELSTHCMQLGQNATKMLNILKKTDAQQLKLKISRQL